MSKVNSLLSKRMKPRSAHSSKKVTALTERSASRGLTPALGGVELNPHEREELRGLLERHAPKEQQELDGDLEELVSLTTEVKAITHQAALLHGERIRRAQELLTQYEEGAFTAWLLNTYGNRQTPYNFLQYFLFWEKMPLTLRPQVETMPRQVIYTLASRHGDMDTKQKLIEDYSGQTKEELLNTIRELFPLEENDKRRQNVAESIVSSLKKVCNLASKKKGRLGSRQKEAINHHLDLIRTLINS